MTTGDQGRAEIPNYAGYLTPAEVGERCGCPPLRVMGWITCGVKTEVGVIHLAAVKLGGRWRIDPAALAVFVAAVTKASLPASATRPAGEEPPPEPETAADMRRRAEACAARLRAKGVLR